MPVLSSASVRNVMLGSTKAKKVYLGTKIVWEADQGPAALYSGTGWYKATDTGIVFCKGIASRQTHSFAGDSKVYISVHTIADAKLYAERAATSNMVDLSRVFLDPGANVNPDISHWDVSNVTDMSYMFNGASAFNRNISNWDVSSATNMRAIFSRASTFNQNISNWDVSNVTDMAYMFNGASAFNQNLTKWCVTKIKSWPSWFNDASALTDANSPKWGTCPRGEDGS